MSKKKMRAFAGAMAVVLAFVPFLSGCAANDAEDNPQAQQELNADEQSRNEAEGSIGETVQYGQVMAMNGSTATVVVGTLANANDGSGSQAFNAGQDEITFDEGDVSIVDESGAELEGRTLSADDVIVMEKGKLVEANTTDELFNNPVQDYTRELIEAVPGRNIQLNL